MEEFSVKEVKEKKKSNVVLIIMVIIFVVAAAIGGWAGSTYYHNRAKEEKTSNNKPAEKKDENVDDTVKEDVTPVELDINDNTVVGLYDGLTPYHTGSNSCGSLDFDYFKDIKVTKDNLGNMIPALVGLNQLVKEGFQLVEGQTFTKEKLHEKIAKVFGNDYNYVDASIYSCPAINYDGTNGLYRVGPSGCGGSCGPASQKKLIRAVKMNDIIELYVKVLFVRSDYGQNTAYFSDYNRINQVSESVDNGGLYKISFQLKDNNYIFVSSEIAQ